MLIRHASAGDRETWTADDDARPLDERGQRQAKELVELLKDYPLERILSSPALRCVQTVEPLARARGLVLEIADELAEGQDAEDLIATLDGADVALSCHGGLSDAVCGERQKKAEVVVLDGTGAVHSRLRARG
jgi:phosphohistidine phosphatase SixA